MRLPAHESTTAQLGAAYPFAASPPLPTSRVLIGQDLAGGPFAHDPFELYAAGAVTNPNVTVLGQIGRGKSALVKTYLLRQAAFGRQVAVLDPKGEYGALARALGSSPITLAPGGPIRVNPLEGPPVPQGMAVSRHRLVLLATLAAACLRRNLSPREHAALELALGAVTRAHLERNIGPPTLPEVVQSLLRPLAESARVVGTTKAGLEIDGRDVGLELRRLVEGDLAGMFDGANIPLRQIGARSSRTSTPAAEGTLVATSTIVPADHFTYEAPWTVTGVNPTAGVLAGGTPVTVTGTNFTGASAVKFGGVDVTSPVVIPSTQITTNIAIRLSRHCRRHRRHAYRDLGQASPSCYQRKTRLSAGAGIKRLCQWLLYPSAHVSGDRVGIVGGTSKADDRYRLVRRVLRA
jgi:hypothetical protein